MRRAEGRRDLHRKVGAMEGRREDGCMAAAGWLAASCVACTTRPGGASTSAHAAGSLGAKLSPTYGVVEVRGRVRLR